MEKRYVYRDETDDTKDVDIPGFNYNPAPALLPRTGDVIHHDGKRYQVINWHFHSQDGEVSLVIRTMVY